MKTRHGKIARLPKEIRELFHGRAISDQNLSQWREGGYADWLRRGAVYNYPNQVNQSDEDQ